MSSVVYICNLALSHIRAGSITSLDEASAEARACKLHYDQARRVLLSSHAWMWARKREAMASLTNTREAAWAYAYRRPSDCLKFLGVQDDYLAKSDPNPTLHEIEGTTIYSHLTPGIAVYVADESDPTRFPPLFIDALAAALAARLATPLTGDRSIKADALQLAQQAFNVAAAADANEDTDRPDYVPEPIEARL